MFEDIYDDFFNLEKSTKKLELNFYEFCCNAKYNDYFYNIANDFIKNWFEKYDNKIQENLKQEIITYINLQKENIINSYLDYDDFIYKINKEVTNNNNIKGKNNPYLYYCILNMIKKELKNIIHTEIIKNNALSKLTPEEKKVLGLE